MVAVTVWSSVERPDGGARVKVTEPCDDEKLLDAASGVKKAVTVWLPGVVNVNDRFAMLSAAVTVSLPIVVAPSLKTTVPVGEPEVPVTVAVRATAWVTS